MPATAICWSTYEFFKYILEGRGQEAAVILRNSSSNSVLPPSPKDVFGIVPAVDASAAVVVHPSESSVKGPRELPAMSGAGMYGALHTMHQQTSSSAATVGASSLQQMGGGRGN